MQINIYVAALAVSAVISIGLAAVAFRRNTVGGSREMAWLMVAAAVWAGSTALEAASLGLPDKIFWSVAAYLGSMSVPVLFLLFALRYSHQDQMGPAGKAALFLLPAVSFVMAATNEQHGWLWSQVSLATHPLLGVVGLYTHGPWFWIAITYAYLMVALGIFALLRAVFRFPQPFSQQYRMVLVAALSPWLLSLLYALRPDFLIGIDLTPATFTWTSILLAWLITRHPFLGLTPVTYEQILGDLHEGILLLDAQRRVIIANRAARCFLGLQAFQAGIPAEQALAGYPDALCLLSGEDPVRSELNTAENATGWLQFERVPLKNNQGQPAGSLLTITDISERRLAEEQLVDANTALRESEARYRMLVENQAEGICIIDTQRRFQFANPAAERILGTAPGELVGRPLDDFVDAEGLEVIQQQAQPRQQDEKTLYELEINHPDGLRRVLEITATGQFSAGGRYLATFCILRDITERKQAELALVASNNALRARQRYLALLSEITRAALAATDRRKLLQTLADQMGALLGADMCYITTYDDTQQLTIPEAATAPLHESYPKHQSLPGEQTMTFAVLEAGHALVAEDVFDSPYMSARIAASYETRSMLGLPLMAGGRKLGAALISFHKPHSFTQGEIELGEQAARQISLALWKAHLLDETQAARSQAEAANSQLEQALEKLDLLATVDALTGAYNRRKFDELIGYELNRMDRYHHPVSLILFDIDYFKGINDTYGHHVGDGILSELVRIVQDNLRETDSLVRWGGDEFIILAPGINQAQAIVLADKIRRILANLTFPTVGSLTISLGVTELHPGDTADDGVRRADRALYIAKRKGRNRVATAGLQITG